MKGQALPGCFCLDLALGGPCSSPPPPPAPPCTPGCAGLRIAGFHLSGLLGQCSTPGRRHRPQEVALGLHTAHRPLLQAAPTGGAARAEVASCPATEERKGGQAPGQVPRLARGMGWEASASVQLTRFPGLGQALCPFGYLDTMQIQPAQPSRCPQAAPEPKDTCVKVLVGSCPSPALTRDGRVPNIVPPNSTCHGLKTTRCFLSGFPSLPPRVSPTTLPGKAIISSCSDLSREGTCYPHTRWVWVTVTHVCLSFSILTCKLTDPPYKAGSRTK